MQGQPQYVPGQPQVQYVQGQPQVQYVQQQPTLQDIARQQNVDIAELLRANPSITSATQALAPSQQIVMPPRQQQQTAADVARLYNVPVQELIRANPTIRVATDPIQPSQRIVIPAPQAAPQQLQQPQVQYVQGQPQYVPGQPQVQYAPGQPQVQYVPGQLHYDTQNPVQSHRFGVVSESPLPYGAQVHFAGYDPRDGSDALFHRFDAAAGGEVSSLMEALKNVSRANSFDPSLLLRSNPHLAQSFSSLGYLDPHQDLVLPPRLSQMSVSELSQLYGVPVSTILNSNRVLRGGGDIVTGRQRLVLPVGALQAALPSQVGADIRSQKREDAIQRVFFTPVPMSVDQIAETVGVTPAELLRVNPYLSADGVVLANTPVRIPGSGDSQAKKLQLPFNKATAYVADLGDTLEAIATRVGIKPLDLLELNPQIANPRDSLPQGTAVFLPTYASGKNRRPHTVYTSAEGDTLHSVGHAFGIPPEVLARQVPSVRSLYDPLLPGQDLAIPLVAPPISAKVERHDTIGSIAARFGVDEDTLRGLNGWTDDNDLEEGRPFRLPHSPPAAAAQTFSSKGAVHVSQAGETVELIAFKYGVLPEDIRKHNPFLRSHTGPVAPGRRILVVADSENVSRLSPHFEYKAAAREDIEAIAAKFNVPARAVREANPHLQDVSQVPSAQTIVIPQIRLGEGRSLLRGVQMLEALTNDTLSSVAYRYGLPVDHVRFSNPTILDDHAIPRGTKLLVAEPSLSHQGTSYCLVQPKDTRASIAKRYRVSEDALRAANPDCNFSPYDVVVVPTSSTNSNFTRVGILPNDSIASVAERYNTTEGVIRSLNPHLASEPADMPLQRQELFVPRSSDPDEARKSMRDVKIVQASDGESIQELAQRVGLSVQELLECNPRLDVGQPLRNRQRVMLPQDVVYSDPAYATSLSQNLHAVRRYTPRDGEAVSVIAHRFNIPEEELLRFNPGMGKIARGKKEILIPIRSGGVESDPQPSTKVARTSLDYYQKEDEIEALGESGNFNREQLGHLREEYFDMYDAMQLSTSARHVAEEKMRAMEQLLSRQDEGAADDLRKRLREISLEFQVFKADAAQREETFRKELERQFARKIREIERTYAEEHERAEAAGDSKTPSLPETVHAADNQQGGALVKTDGKFDGLGHHMPPDLDAFLSFKSEQYQKVFAKLRTVEAERESALSQIHTLNHELERVAKIRSTRQPLLRILFDLHKSAQKCDHSTSDLIAKVNVRELSKRLLMDELSKILEEVRTIASGQKFIVQNMFFESEVLHLGASPSHFADEATSLNMTRTTTTTLVSTTTTSVRRAPSPRISRTPTRRK